MKTKKMLPQVSDKPIKHSYGLIGDLHFGSIYAPMQEFKTFDNRKIVPSPEQQKLNEIFSWCIDMLDYWNVRTILFSGDLIQGKNYKDQSRSLVTADLDEQQELALNYLTPFIDSNIVGKRKVYGVSGTSYHQSVDTEIEKKIIEGLGGTFLNKMAWLTIPDSKRILNLSHESAKATVYPYSACEREASLMFRAFGDGHLPYKPDVIIRGHRHIFGHLHTTAYHFILVPAFQVWYPFKTSYYGAVQSDIGIAILFIDSDDRIIVHHYTRPSTDIRIGDKTYQL
jgi:hypothetical protein